MEGSPDGVKHSLMSSFSGVYANAQSMEDLLSDLVSLFIMPWSLSKSCSKSWMLSSHTLRLMTIHRTQHFGEKQNWSLRWAFWRRSFAWGYLRWSPCQCRVISPNNSNYFAFQFFYQWDVKVKDPYPPVYWGKCCYQQVKQRPDYISFHQWSH